MTRIFISYSHQDEAWKERVVRQLRVLEPVGVDPWDDRRIAAGTGWEEEIGNAIAACDVALLLISPHFLASRFILGQEVPPLLQRREEQGLRVIPVIVSSCAWDLIPWLKEIQARPKDGEPLSGMRTHDADAALTALVEEIAALHVQGREAELAKFAAGRRAVRRVFISSTAIDLPAHRGKVVDACYQLGFLPDGMEHWPAADAAALDLCLAKVDAADLFVGIYGHRYGWVPPGQSKSITELEYDRAVERGLPCFLFVMAEDHPLTAADVETGPGISALNAFKQRLGGERVWQSFANADQLHAAVLHALMGQATPDGDAAEVPVYFNDHFPKGAQHFLGRGAELKALAAAWEDDGTAIVTLIAPGGTGKTALVLRWLAGMRQEGWRGGRQVFGWSFYTQGTRASGETSEDGFLAKALACFGIPHDPALHAADKGRLLAEALHRRRCLLLLDGVEPLQYPPGPMAGRLRGPGLEALLHHLALAGQPGLCVVTSRERLADLAGHERSRSHAEGNVLRRDLANLSLADGARLLHQLGANRAGRTAIAADDPELKEASQEVRGHALTLALFGRYLAQAHGGDIRKRKEVSFRQADRDGHTFKVMAAYEQWLSSGGEESQRELAALRLVGFFDRPATRDNLAALTSAPAIPGLTEPLQGIADEEWNLALVRLADCGLVETDAEAGGLDSHPLVREYFAAALAENRPDVWREGHRRLYEHLKGSTPHRPDDLVGLQPLYHAVTHGCRAGLYQEALDEVYRDRILRGTGADGYYSTFKLGAIGADLGAVACFFVALWQRPAPALDEGAQAWLLNEAAFHLGALGRLSEALGPMRAGAEMAVTQEDWKNAARYYGNLSELQLGLGRVAAAVADAGQAVAYADRSGDASMRMIVLTTLADARHQQGEAEGARQAFAEAEQMQVERQPASPLLYSLQGFLYCDLLLAVAERAAWQGERDAALAEACSEVARRAVQTLVIAERNHWLLDIALNHLTLARCALYADRLHGRPPGVEAQRQTEAAVAGLRQAGRQDHIPRGLLTRAWLRHGLDDAAGATADLDEAHRIAARGSMRLHLADIALTRARLFGDRAVLAEARRLIEECGYGRRLPELEDAEAEFGRENWQVQASDAAPLFEDYELKPTPFMPPLPLRPLSMEEVLTLAFQLVLRDHAEPGLLTDLNANTFQRGIANLAESLKRPNDPRVILAWFDDSEKTPPDPLWLAWAANAHGDAIERLGATLTA